MPSEQYWTESKGGRGAPAVGYVPQESRSRNKWIKWGSIAIAVLAVIGIVTGVAVSQTTKNKNSGSGSSSQENSISGANGTSQVGNDPSNFKKDDSLHQSFWAMAYTPEVFAMTARRQTDGY